MAEAAQELPDIESPEEFMKRQGQPAKPVGRGLSALVKGQIPMPRARPEGAPKVPLPDIQSPEEFMKAQEKEPGVAPTSTMAPTSTRTPTRTAAGELPDVQSPDEFISANAPEPKKELPSVADVTMGYPEIIAKAAGRGAFQSGQAMVAGATTALPAALGGTALTDQPKLDEGPEDDVNTLVKTRLADGWWSGKWWVAKAADMAGRMGPSYALGAVGALAGGANPIPGGAVTGGVGGFVLGSALETIVPAYQAGIAKGLSVDDAINQALLDTGIAAGFSTLMGFSPGMSVYGRDMAGLLQRPIKEALTQIGIIQPTLGVAQTLVTAAANKETVTPSDLIESGVMSAFGMAPFVGMHTLGQQRQARINAERGATARGLLDAYLDATGLGLNDLTGKVIKIGPDGAPVDALSERISQEQARREPWFSAVQQRIEEKGPKAAPGWRWGKILEGVEGGKEEQQWLRLPVWLENAKGDISKEDLIHYVEANRLRVEERVYGEGEERPTKYAEFTTPGPRTGYREITLRLPVGEEKVFRSEHFPDPNVVAHFRVTDRIDRDGMKTMHIEEIQSDWHQRGRARGYWEPKDAPPKPQTWSDFMKERGIPDAFALNLDNAPPEVVNLYREHQAAVAKRMRERSDFFDTVRGKMPDAPFKTTWDELAFKRVLQLAAGEGVQRVTWSNGKQQILRYPALDERQQNGMRQFYDVRLPNLAKKWANRLGMDTGETRLDLGPAPREPTGRAPMGWMTAEEADHKLWKMYHDDEAQQVKYVDLNPMVADVIKGKGLPLFSRPGEVVLVEPSTKIDPTTHPQAAKLLPAARLVQRGIENVMKRMGITEPLKIELHDDLIHNGRRIYGSQGPDAQGQVIKLNLGMHETAETLWSTASHEFGHFVQKVMYDKASPTIKLAIDTEFREWLKNQSLTGKVMPFLAERGSALHPDMQRYMRLTQGGGPIEPWMRRDVGQQWTQSELDRYWASFSEWFAERTARWATSSGKPLSEVDKFFSSMGRAVRKGVVEVQQHFGLAPDPKSVMQDWLDTSMKGGYTGHYQDVMDEVVYRTKVAAQQAVAGQGVQGFPAVAQTAASGGLRGMTGRLFGGTTPPGGAAAGAMVDKFNKFYEVALGVHQLAQRNPDNRLLQVYVDINKMFAMRVEDIVGRGYKTLKEWHALGKVQGDAIAGMMDEYMNMRYRTPAEIAKGVERMPTQAEFTAMARKYGVDNRGLAVFTAITNDFKEILTKDYRKLMTDVANRGSDPIAVARRIQDLEAEITKMASKPYFPMTRFGEYTLTVRDAAGHVTDVQAFESIRKRDAAFNRLQLKPGETPQRGMWSKDTEPMLGLPPNMLELMKQKLALSPDQLKALDELKFIYSPERSFRQHFQLRDRTPGYSQDFMRAYGNYFFSASRHFARLEFGDQMQDVISRMASDGKMMPDSTKREQLVEFLKEHKKDVMDPKMDWAGLRSAMFTWQLAYSPAAATLNLSQIFFGSYTNLAPHFGDFKALAAIANAGRQFSTYYKKGTLMGSTAGRERALGEAVRQGTIGESMAMMIAGVAEGRNILSGFGGNAAERAVFDFLQGGAKMFELTEQANRRITFGATWDLAQAHPDNAYIQAAVKAQPLTYARLLDQGWTEKDAAAFTAAKKMTEDTQFIYGKWARPKFMQGKVGSNLFIFHSFTQSTLFNIMNNPRAAWRFMLMMGVVGGAMGLPGAEDINGIIKGLAWQLGDKDWDLEDGAREFVKDVLGGKVKPDILLHGLSKDGYGIPQLLELIGVPFPKFDRSRSVSMGNLLPVEPGKLLGPAKDAKGAELAQIQRASGATFGLPFALYNALFASPLDKTDFKRWEQVMPKFLSNASHSFRYYREEMERNSKGNAVVRFDPTDTMSMVEILGRAMGYQPARVTAAQEGQAALRDAVMVWDLRRETLVRQAWAARQSRDPAAWEKMVRAIIKFNGDLPDEAKGKAIQPSMLRRGFDARIKQQARQELGLPSSKANAGIEQRVRELYPDLKPAGRSFVK